MSDQPFFLARNQGFAVATAADDFLHPAQNAEVTGDSLTETQYLGFSVPAHGIHALGYLWHHPNLRTLTGGLMAFQGHNPYSLSAHLFDMRTFQSDALLRNDLHEYRMENSYSVRVVEPLRRLHMSYHDTTRDNHAELAYTAITPPLMFGDGKHFEQGMRVVGELVLRGQPYKVDGYNVRDRSWAKLRPEDAMSLPPVAWMTGCFGEDFVFNCNLIDHAGSNPRSAGMFAVPEERALNGGWIVRGGSEVSRVVKASKRVRRHMATLVPEAMELSLTDEQGRVAVLTGRVLASCPFSPWHNMLAHISLVEWSMDGKTGHGDSQDPLWNDYAHAWVGKHV